MIPMQTITNRKSQALDFCRWIALEDIPRMIHQANSETALQLAQTFYHLTGTYGFRLNHNSQEAFMEVAMESGNAVIRIPRIYFRGDEPGTYLMFDWAMWLNQSGFLLGP